MVTVPVGVPLPGDAAATVTVKFVLLFADVVEDAALIVTGSGLTISVASVFDVLLATLVLLALLKTA